MNFSCTSDSDSKHYASGEATLLLLMLAVLLTSSIPIRIRRGKDREIVERGNLRNNFFEKIWNINVLICKCFSIDVSFRSKYLASFYREIPKDSRSSSHF